MRKLRDWLHDHATAIGTGAAVVTVLLTAVAFVFGWGALNPFAEAPATVVQGYSIEQHEAALARREAQIRADLKQAHDAHLALLRRELAEIERQKADLDASFRTRTEELGRLRKELEGARGAGIAGERIEAAQAALSNGETELADRIFAEVEKMEQGSIERAADAACQRGLIAEDEVRWADAANHFARAARLAPDFDRLFKARAFAWRAGAYGPARALGPKLIAAAIAEHGERSAEHATALNEHALTLYAMGRYPQAEPLFRQVIEITGEARGTDHPDYAISLNNLAALLRATGRYAEAEPLYRQAMEIRGEALGTDHPDYGQSLNNLALLLERTERAGAARGLYAEALEVLRAALGAGHPHTRHVAGNYAHLLREHFPDDPALGALEAEFGAEIGREG